MSPTRQNKKGRIRWEAVDLILRRLSSGKSIAFLADLLMISYQALARRRRTLGLAKLPRGPSSGARFELTEHERTLLGVAEPARVTAARLKITRQAVHQAKKRALLKIARTPTICPKCDGSELIVCNSCQGNRSHFHVCTFCEKGKIN